jgi:hypothetical protein
MSLKQVTMFEDEKEESQKYSKFVGSPVYEPRGKAPDVFELCDKSKYQRLLSKIEDSKLGEKEKEFLKICASRHLVFNYEIIADYYASASKEMQELMEDSALVIIDFDDAIEKGYVELSKEVKKQYMEIRNG